MVACLNRASWLLFFGMLVAAGCAANRAAAAEQNQLTAQELADGWIQLFDGETLFGWTAASNANWKVIDGTITATQGDPGLLHTTSQFANYVLKVDFRGEKGCDSGVFLRTIPAPTRENVATACYEVNIADWGASDWPTGSIVGRKRCDRPHDSTDWRTYELSADGGHFVVKLDGAVVLDYTDPKPLGRGLIGLQFRKGKIEFRNVKLKPLGTKSIFNGKDLTGWASHRDSKSVCTLRPEGWLNIKKGWGNLEYEGRYADFTLQLESFVNGKALNSGIFFRSIPGDLMNGYECQIHNGYRDGDRTKPQDCGTGGIFRRQNARKVIPDDFQWFHLTIHADGPHMAAWVNGCQVSDWTDDRTPDANPRKGKRLEAGTIQIQGHDATTDLSFRNLRIAELP